jgi:L-asparaginase II
VSSPAPALLAEVIRSGLVESRHRGAVVGLAADGAQAFAVGPVEQPVFPRSCNKPLQATALVRAGLAVEAPLLAVAAASHSGEPRHVELVCELLHRHGLEPSALENTPDLPLDPAAARQLLRDGGGPDSLHQNCSGKHAAMLATCRVRGWPTAGYRLPSHPVQLAIRDTVQELAGESVSAVGVDGCGAPLFAISLVGLARAFRSLVLGATGSAPRVVADAMRAHPELVGGSGRAVSLLMRANPGLLAKDGAEGCYALATADGAAVALKIEDGSARACPPVAVEALRRLGAEPTAPPDVAEPPVLGHGEPVGEVRAVPIG